MVAQLKNPLPRQLDRRPEAAAISVEDLLHKIRAGEIRTHDFQRELNWKEEDKRLFFDSLLLGYPVGTLLLWKRPAEAKRVHFGSIEVDAPKRSDALWVIDGQQRLATLADALIAEPSMGRQLYADLESSDILWGRPAEQGPPRFLPLREIADLERLLEWVHQHKLPDELRRSAFDLAKRVREYQVPAYLVEATDDKVLREIFRRTNEQGKPLKSFEVFDALNINIPPQIPSSIRELSVALEQEGFGRLEGDLILRSLLAVQGLDWAGGAKRTRGLELPKVLEEAAAALRGAIVFIRAAGIPHIRLVPYRFVLIALARFFHLQPEPSDRSRRLLARWLWRGAINSTLRGDRGLINKTLAAISADENGSIQSLLQLTGSKPQSIQGLGPFDFSSARSKLQTLALLDLGPLDLTSRMPIEIGTLCEHQQVPLVTLATTSNRQGSARTLASRLLHQYLPPMKLRERLADSPSEVLGSHGISSTMMDLLVRQPDDFFALRERSLEEHVSLFLDRRAEWRDNDRPPIAQFNDEDDAEDSE